MSADRIEKILRALRKKLESDRVPDDLTGSLKLNFQSGMLSGKIKMEAEIE